MSNAREAFLAPADFWRLSTALEALDQGAAAVVRVLYSLGWRRDEVLAMTWHEVDLDGGTVCMPTRGEEDRPARRLPLAADLLALFRARWEARKGELVFHRGGSPLEDFSGLWKRAVEAIGRPELFVRDLRSSFMRNAIQAGVAVETIMIIAGLRIPSVFLRYVGVDERMMAEGLERLGE